MSFKAIKAGEDQIDTIKNILSSAVEYKNAHHDSSWGTGLFSEDEVKDQISSMHTYLVYSDYEPIGTFALSLDDSRIWGKQQPNAAYLHRLAVTNGLHGRGFGNKIIDLAEVEARKLNCQLLRLDCEVSNKKLCAYYEKQGFMRVNTRLIQMKSKSYNAALYEKSV